MQYGLTYDPNRCKVCGSQSADASNISVFIPADGPCVLSEDNTCKDCADKMLLEFDKMGLRYGWNPAS